MKTLRKKLRAAQTAHPKDFGPQLVNLHSAVYQVGACRETMGKECDRDGRPARAAFALLEKLRVENLDGLSLGDVSEYYRHWTVGHNGYSIHADIPVNAFLTAIETALNAALEGDADFTRPLREVRT